MKYNGWCDSFFKKSIITRLQPKVDNVQLIDDSTNDAGTVR